MHRRGLSLCICVFEMLICAGLGLPYSNHPCRRSCIEDPAPKTCFYHFVVEEYLSLSKACYDCPLNVSDCYRTDCVPADGIRRRIVTANRQLPGPSIEICQGDYVIVDVDNRMASMGTAIHWHGIHQYATPHMDGVPMITQCAIQPFTTFRYQFPVTQYGTYLWHSHVGLQKADGLTGPFIVRAANDPQQPYYDQDLFEHVIFINDWISASADEKFVVAYHHDGAANKPDNILVNGKGKGKKWLRANATQQTSTVHVPYEVFTVEYGKRYRFRMISSGFLNCPVKFSIDGHVLVVIAMDGMPVQPVVTDALVLYSGERLDFVLHATEKASNYWMKFHGLSDGDEHFTSVYQAAVLKYQGASDESLPEDITYESSDRMGRVLNPLHSVRTSSQLTVDALNSALPDSKWLSRNPDFQFYVWYDFYYIDNPLFNLPVYYPSSAVKPKERLLLPLFNHIHFMMPPSPLLTQWESVPKDVICNQTSIQKNCATEFCSCVQLLKVSTNSVVELVLVDEGASYNVSHVIHLHGYHFHVVAMGILGEITTLEEVQRLDRKHGIHRKLHKAVLKDTVTVPDGGFTIIRFYADNPGLWLMHCHLDYHMETGMALVIQVGDPEEFFTAPQDFPKCGNWVSSQQVDF